MICPNVDESDILKKLVSSLIDYTEKFGHPPVSTAVLFEPYYQCWGIYHASRLMPIAAGDSPGDYDFPNAEVGDMALPDSDYDRAAFATYLQEVGHRLVASLTVSLMPGKLAICLDYDWLCEIACHR